MFIQLTWISNAIADETKIWLNINQIVSFCVLKNTEYTSIYTLEHGDENLYRVRETPEEILSLIKQEL